MARSGGKVIWNEVEMGWESYIDLLHARKPSHFCAKTLSQTQNSGLSLKRPTLEINFGTSKNFSARQPPC